MTFKCVYVNICDTYLHAQLNTAHNHMHAFIQPRTLKTNTDTSHAKNHFTLITTALVSSSIAQIVSTHNLIYIHNTLVYVSNLTSSSHDLLSPVSASSHIFTVHWAAGTNSSPRVTQPRHNFASRVANPLI